MGNVWECQSANNLKPRLMTILQRDMGISWGQSRYLGIKLSWGNMRRKGLTGILGNEETWDTTYWDELSGLHKKTGQLGTVDCNPSIVKLSCLNQCYMMVYVWGMPEPSYTRSVNYD